MAGHRQRALAMLLAGTLVLTAAWLLGRPVYYRLMATTLYPHRTPAVVGGRGDDAAEPNASAALAGFEFLSEVVEQATTAALAGVPVEPPQDPAAPTQAPTPQAAPNVPRKLRYPFFDAVDPPSPYRSVGHTKPWRGELEGHGQLAAMAKARAYRGELIMLTSDAERLELAANFIRMLVHRWGFDHYIMIGLNKHACDSLANTGALGAHELSCAWSEFLEEELKQTGGTARVWGGLSNLNNIAQLWITRHRLMDKLIDLDVNVLSIDNDVAIVKDPYADFKREIPPSAAGPGIGPSDVELFVQHHGGFPGICAGVIYQQRAKPGGGVQFFFREVWTRMLDGAKGPPLFSRIPGQEGAPYIEVYTFDQGPTDDVIESSVGAASDDCADANRYMHNGVLLLPGDEAKHPPPSVSSVPADRQIPAWAIRHSQLAGGGPCSTSFRHQLFKLSFDHAGFMDTFKNIEWTWVKGTQRDHLLSVPFVERGEPLKAVRDLLLPRHQPHVEAGGRYERVAIAPGYLVSAWSDAKEAATWHVQGGGSAIAHAVGQSGGYINKKFLMRAIGWYHPDSDFAAGTRNHGLRARLGELETMPLPPPTMKVRHALPRTGDGPRMLALRSTPALLGLLRHSKGAFRAAFGRLFELALALGRKPVVPLIPCDAEWFSQRPDKHATTTIDRDVQALAAPVADPDGPTPPESAEWQGVGQNYGRNANRALCYWNPLLNFWQICDEQFVFHHYDLAAYTAMAPIVGWTLPGEQNIVDAGPTCTAAAAKLDANSTPVTSLLATPPTIDEAAFAATDGAPVVYIDVGQLEAPCVPMVDTGAVRGKAPTEKVWEDRVAFASRALVACNVCTDDFQSCPSLYQRSKWTCTKAEAGAPGCKVARGS